METLLIEVAKHSFVVAVLFALFLVILFLVYMLVLAKLNAIQKDMDGKLAAMKVDQKVENDKHSIEIQGVKDKLHSLGNSVTNCVTQIGQTDRKIDLILVHLGENPIKMARDNAH